MNNLPFLDIEILIKLAEFTSEGKAAKARYIADKIYS